MSSAALETSSHVGGLRTGRRTGSEPRRHGGGFFSHASGRKSRQAVTVRGRPSCRIHFTAGEQRLKQGSLSLLNGRGNMHTTRAQAVPAHGLPHGGLQWGRKSCGTQRGGLCSAPVSHTYGRGKSVRRHGKAPFFLKNYVYIKLSGEIIVYLF